MSKTKEKIIETAKRLFNEEGYANTTVQSIASAVGISLGNLTYHFPKKDDLMHAIYQRLLISLRTLLQNSPIDKPDFRIIEILLRRFYNFQQEFRFFYLYTLDIERSYPKIATGHRDNVKNQIVNIYSILHYNVRIGNLKILSGEEEIKNIAEIIWMTAAFWSTQKEVQGEKSFGPESMVDAVWTILRPHFTDQGMQAYKVLQKEKLSI